MENTKFIHTLKNFCRFCEILHANDCLPKKIRTPETYDECVRAALISSTMVKGIKRNSSFNVIKSYHVCNPGLSPCIAHDLHEGIIQYDLMLAIKSFIKKKWLRLGLLNFRLQNLKPLTDSTSTNCLPIIKESYKKLRGTASHVRRFLHIFPAAIHDLIKDARDLVWQMVLALQEVFATVCAPAFSLGQVVMIDNNIEEYLQLWVHAFPKIPLKPKHHYLSHYPALIEELGPVKNSQSIRLESKHISMKNAAKHCQNLKNITKIL